MAKKKIIISASILESFNKEECVLDDISLKFVITDSYHKINIDLTNLLDGTLKRRKEVQIFKNFLINTPKSLSTKKAYYKVFKQMFFAVVNHNGKNINEILSIYHAIQLEKIKHQKITNITYETIQTNLQIIFIQCFNLNFKEFIQIFPNYIQRTKTLDNALVLDSKGKEKSFSKLQFKEISKIFSELYVFFESIEKNEQLNNKVNFSHRNIYSLDIHLNITKGVHITNKKTFCLLIIFISLTGINLAPLIRMKRSDIIIDKERNFISFNAICNRKNKIQSHKYPMRDNQLKFFQKIIENSLSISPENDILFPFLLSSSEVSYFESGIYKAYTFFNKGFCGDYEGLTITFKKLRHTFGSQFNDIDLRSIALFNSINTAAKNYSTGNSEENNNQLQNAMNIYTIALSNSEDIQIVKENIDKINVISIKDIQTLKQENSQITSSGLFCVNSKEGKEPETFSRKINQLNLQNIDTINCANILACFNCKNSIIVNDFENIYLLKSFYNYLNEIVYESDTSSLFSDKNAVKNALISIKIILDSKIDKKIIKKVGKHIYQYGNHKLWNFDGEFLNE